MTQSISTNTFTVAKWVVSPDPTQGTHTTIQSAINSASSGEAVFIRDGTYTENLTLKAGVNLTALTGSSSGAKVIIIGKLTASYSGTVTLANLRFQTNGDYSIELIGSNQTILFLENCYFELEDFNSINNACSNSLSRLYVDNSYSLFTDATKCLIVNTSTGTTTFKNCYFEGTGAASTSSTGNLQFINCVMYAPLNITGDSWLLLQTSQLAVPNGTCVTLSSSGNIVMNCCLFTSGTAPSLVINDPAVCNTSFCYFLSFNPSVISGTGTLTYGVDSFGSSSNVTVANIIPIESIGKITTI